MEWISVDTRRPPQGEWIILGCWVSKRVDMGIYMDGEFVNPDLRYMQIEGVTHWMPLPNAPKDDQNDSQSDRSK